jgi:hypothetical protein
MPPPFGAACRSSCGCGSGHHFRTRRDGILIALSSIDLNGERAVPKKTRRRPTISPKSRRGRRLAWAAIAAGASYAAARGTALLLDEAYERARDRKAPRDPLARDTTLPVVLGWAAASAIVIGLAEIAAQRGAARLFERATGHRPPRQ